MNKKLCPKSKRLFIFICLLSISFAVRATDAYDPGSQEWVQRALKQNDINLLADQFSYPLTIRLANYCNRHINSPAEFAQNFSTIFSRQDIDNMEHAKTKPECDSAGCSMFTRKDARRGSNYIAFSMWAEDGEKISVINSIHSRIACDVPQGAPIQAIHDPVMLEKFVQLYNSQVATKDNNKRLRTEDYKKDYGLTFEPGEMDSMGGDGPHLKDNVGNFFQLFNIDINNDGQDEYTLVYYDNSSEIDAVFQLHENQLHKIYFPYVDTGISHVAYPFVTQQDGKYLLNYKMPGVCTYVWEGSKVKLVHGAGSGCEQIQ